jgi:hypothetical protein
MSSTQKASVALNRAIALIDCNSHNDITEQYKFLKQTLLDEKSLTKNEKSEAMKLLRKNYDENKIRFNIGTKRVCENCNQECLAKSYCELCVRNYLKENFLNWTSKNDNIDNLIQECQMKTIRQDGIIEWIPYNNLQYVKYLTKGGISEIYTAKWIDGGYYEWDSKERQLKRFGEQSVVLKRLENVESANQSWFEEVCILKKKKYLNNNYNKIYLFKCIIS